MVITSLENNYIKNILKLKEKKYRDSENLYLVEGFHLVTEAEKRNLIEEIFILENMEYNSSAKVTKVSEKVMKKLSSLETPSEIIAVVHKNENKKIGNNVIVLEKIQDPGNLGTIIRTATAFNVDTIILGPECVDLYNSKVIRATQGMIFHNNIVIEKNLLETLKELKNNDYLIMGTEVSGGTNIRNLVFNKKIAIIIGNEGSGMSKEVAELCDDFLYIKMHKNCESLNAAVATAILMYEVFNK